MPIAPRRLISGPFGQATLPSVVAAEMLFNGQTGGMLAVLGSTLGRATIIGTGMFLAGERDNVVRNALAGAVAIETFVLLRVGWQVRQERQTVPPAQG